MVRAFKRIGARLSISVTVEPEWGFVAQLKGESGRRRYCFVSTADVNGAGATATVKDKDFAAFFMQKAGFPVVRGSTFFSDHWAKSIGSRRTLSAALRYAKEIGYPVITKPNRGAQGRDVYMARTEKELRSALTHMFIYHKVVIIQPFVEGVDHRIVVLDGAVAAAYVRVPLSVVGDGRSAIKTLLKRKMREYRGARHLSISTGDERIVHRLARFHMTLDTIPPKGACVTLLDNANLSSGGSVIDVTETLHAEYKKAAIAVTREMGLTFAGVDMLIDGDDTRAKKPYHILEVNASPGLEHFSHIGPRQRTIVEAIYSAIFTRIMEQL
jgi:D-alanine-D-alanine ligase-like ATP-grasp enzyme